MNKKKKILVIIILILSIGLSFLGFAFSKKILKKEEKETDKTQNYKKFDMSMEGVISVYPSMYNYHDANIPYEITISDIKIKDKIYNLKYVRNYDNETVSFYLDNKEILTRKITVDILNSVFVIGEYIFVETGWGFDSYVFIIDTKGEIIKELNGDYNYENGVVLVVKSSELSDGKHLFESYKFNLDSDLTEYDNREDEVKCEEYINNQVMEKEQLERYIEDYCYKYLTFNK